VKRAKRDKLLFIKGVYLSLRSRVRIGLILVSIFLVVLLGGILSDCRPSKEEPLPLIRVMEFLQAENFTLTPWSSRSAEPGSFSVPDQTEIKEFLGKRQNPWGALRKWKLGGTEREIIAAPPPTQFWFEGRIEPGSRMKFGLGIASPPVESPSSSEKEVAFRIILQAKARKKTLFFRRVALPQAGETVNFDFQEVTFPAELKEVKLIFQTEGPEGTASFWINPIIIAPQKERPVPVILISIDTLRADHLHCYGYERSTSANIDSLARDGVLFERVYAPSSWTLPSHVSLLTSLYCFNHQVETGLDRLSPELTTLADIFRKKGYYCAAFTGGGFLSTVYGYSRGFDLYRDDLGGVFQQEGAAQVARATLDWLRQNKELPFFLFIHTYQPHSPYACPYPYKARFLPENPKWGHLDLIGYLGGKQGIFKPLPQEERENIIALYDGEILYTDEVLIGRLLAALKELGLYERSMIIVTSDHGEEFYEHQSWGHGQDLYEESLRVPLIIKFPDGSPSAKRIRQPVRLIDIFPTIVDFLKLKTSDFLASLDGETLWPLVQGKKQSGRESLAELAGSILNSHLPRRTALFSQGKKLIINEEFSPEALKFFSFPPPDLPRLELFNLNRDPQERENLATQEPEVVRQFLRRLEELYQAARRLEKKKARLTRRLKEELRALGYLK